MHGIFPIKKQSLFPFIFSLIPQNLEPQTYFDDIISTTKLDSAEFVKAFAHWCDTSSLASRCM